MERLGERISRHRAELAWTQQQLADRLAISRVALSNLESSRSAPGERTVVLMAGLFGVEPHELVAGTDYPPAKAERLPLVAARHTEVTLQLALLERDFRWLEGVPRQLAVDILRRWSGDLSHLATTTHDLGERTRVTSALRQVNTLLD